MTGRSGNVLGYDALRQLISWQNQATNPTQTASYAYNGSGERVQQSVTSGGATTTTSYIGAYEEVSVTGGTTTTTKYYSAGLATVVNVNGTLTYLVNDTLGSVSAALTAAGGVQATALYSPYGSVRYSSGTMPTSHGYTKQRQDPSGLNYDHARYYDASVGQFISADSAQGPNRYGYVAGNPETMTDPTGQRVGTPCDGESASDCTPYKKPTTPQSPPPPPPTHPTTPAGNPSCDPTTSGNCSQWEQQNDYGYTDAQGHFHSGVRKQALDNMNGDANFKIGLGYLAILLTDALEFAYGGSIEAKLEAFIDLSVSLGSIVTYLGAALSHATNSPLDQIYQFALKANSVVHWAAGIAHETLGAYKALGAFAGWMINRAFGLFTGVMEGPMALILSIGTAIVGDATNAWGHFEIQEGNAELAKVDQQANMNIFDWCVENGGGKCTGVPNN